MLLKQLFSCIDQFWKSLTSTAELSLRFLHNKTLHESFTLAVFVNSLFLLIIMIFFFYSIAFYDKYFLKAMRNESLASDVAF